MDVRQQWRKKATLALESYFRKRSFPRTMLSALVAVTGLIGFLFSRALLHFGVEHMWLRYPLAVLGSYTFFLALLRLWVELERRRFAAAKVEIDLSEESLPETPDSTPRSGRGGGSCLDWLDFPGVDLIPDAEGCLFGLVLVAMAVALGCMVFVLIGVVIDAPSLLAEVFLDAFLVTALYRRLRVAAREHWLGTAVRRTWWPAVIAALLLALAGWGLEGLAPDTHTLWPALRWVFGGGGG